MPFAKHSLAPDENEPELTVFFSLYLPHQSKLIYMFENTLDHHEHAECAIQWIRISLTCQCMVSFQPPIILLYTFSPILLHLDFATPQINLEDLRSIVSQCNMLQEHEK